MSLVRRDIVDKSVNLDLQKVKKFFDDNPEKHSDSDKGLVRARRNSIFLLLLFPPLPGGKQLVLALLAES